MASESLTARIRHWVYGRRTSPDGGELARTAPSAISNAANVALLGRSGAPGEFDSPPSEPVTIDGPIPWELQDPEETVDEPKPEAPVQQ